MDEYQTVCMWICLSVLIISCGACWVETIIRKTKEKRKNRRLIMEWVKIKERRLTDEERESYGEEYDYIMNCKVPSNGEEVLVTTSDGYVMMDIYSDGYFENNPNPGDLLAWMPLPKPYKPKEEKPMKVMREIETEADRLQVGDRIKVNFSGEEHFATAIEERGDTMLFLTDDYLDEAMEMNPTSTTKGDWEGSLLREKLQDLAENTDIKDQLVPFENGDLLTLLSIQEMFGLDEHFDKCSGQIEWLKDRRHRIADRKGEPYEWGWLRSVVSASNFALVGYNGGASADGASDAYGVRPAFQIEI